MKIAVEVNIHDAISILKAYYEAKFPGVEVGNVNVVSWNRPVFIYDGYAVEFGDNANVRHVVRTQHGDIGKPNPADFDVVR
jgi:hypothetical protein